MRGSGGCFSRSAAETAALRCRGAPGTPAHCCTGAQPPGFHSVVAAVCLYLQTSFYGMFDINLNPWVRHW